MIHPRLGILRKQDWCLIGACWLITQLIILWYFGINVHGESNAYIKWSNDWRAGIRHFDPDVIFYSGYVAIHVLLRSLGLPLKSMYGFQLLLSALTVYYFIRILSRWVLSRRALMLGAILYTTCFIIQLYVSLLYTESVFCNLLLIGSYYLLAEDERPHNRAICWIFILLLPFFRPVGFLFAALACGYWTTTSLRRNRWKVLACIAYIACISVVIKISFAESPGFFYPYHNIEANVICGYPGDLLQYRRVPYQEGMSVPAYLFQNPGMTTRLFGYRLYKVFSLTRPYYSTRHNFILVINSLLYCTLALLGLYRLLARREKNKYFLLIGILLFSIPCIIFCVDWEGRFSIPVYGFLLLAAGIGLDTLPFIRSPAPAPPAPHQNLS